MSRSSIYAALMSFWMDMKTDDDLFDEIGAVLAAMIKEKWFVENAESRRN